MLGRFWFGIYSCDLQIVWGNGNKLKLNLRAAYIHTYSNTFSFVSGPRLKLETMKCKVVGGTKREVKQNLDKIGLLSVCLSQKWL